MMNEKKIKITLELTEKEATLLTEVLGSYEDCGPSGSGWQSDELALLSSVVDGKVRVSQLKKGLEIASKITFIENLVYKTYQS